jgi:hypothetical protein
MFLIQRTKANGLFIDLYNYPGTQTQMRAKPKKSKNRSVLKKKEQEHL